MFFCDRRSEKFQLVQRNPTSKKNPRLIILRINLLQEKTEKSDCC